MATSDIPTNLHYIFLYQTEFDLKRDFYLMLFMPCMPNVNLCVVNIQKKKKYQPASAHWDETHTYTGSLQKETHFYWLNFHISLRAVTCYIMIFVEHHFSSKYYFSFLLRQFYREFFPVFLGVVVISACVLFTKIQNRVLCFHVLT